MFNFCVICILSTINIFIYSITDLQLLTPKYEQNQAVLHIDIILF